MGFKRRTKFQGRGDGRRPIWRFVLGAATVISLTMVASGTLQSPGEFYSDMEVRRRRERDEQTLADLRKAGQELEALTRQLAKRFDAVPQGVRPQLSNRDLEDLKRIEKLAKRVRELQGVRGDGEDTQPLPTDFGAQLALLSQLSAEVRQAADKASRFTLSVGILSRTTRILRLSRSLRSG
ncbi:MAG: hypothetical protein NZ585_05205 [Chloracidobacterium sp.]|nr:hypothetical protein [Chloracidobacterium sp.]MDW8216908.1 hypothetical protein [Acidobacteriota bacterium]